MTAAHINSILHRGTIVLALAIVVTLHCASAQAGFAVSTSFLDNWTAVRTVVGFPDETQRTLTDVLSPVNTPTSTSISRSGASDEFINLGEGLRIGGRAESSGFATASQGVLHAFARAFAGVGEFGPNTSQLFASYASARFEASFDDNITLGGNLPIGAPVEFDFTWGYTSELTPEPSPLVNVVNTAVTGVFARVIGPNGLFLEGNRTSNDFSQGNSTTTFRISGHAGDELFVFMSLAASAFAKMDAHFGSSLAIADASHTAFLYLDPVTPGLKIESFSGHDYSSPGTASPVPEPAGLPMLALGACVLAVGRWMRRGRTSAFPG